LTIHFCISSRNDPAFPILERLLHDFSTFDARIFVEAEDPALVQNSPALSIIGPNPKIRNMSRGYRESKGDIIWIIDCNVWVDTGVCGRMVDKLCGFPKNSSSSPYKFVHQLPICVDVDNQLSAHKKRGLSNGDLGSPNSVGATKTHRSWLSVSGGRLEELFLSSSHAKFYTAINTLSIAPCIVGKSNMFRRSHLNCLTSSTPASITKALSPNPSPGEGIDHFSYNICEDHLIGDLLWHSTIPSNPYLGNHGLVFGDLAIQPIANMSISAYTARRVRWLRVRKFTVTLATLVEPGTESFLCSAYGAYGLTGLEWCKSHLGLSGTWTAFTLLWLLSISIWALVDWTVYILLHSGRTIEAADSDMPPFARSLNRLARRPFLEWLAAWLGREALALPIWIWAFWGGVTVVWRDRKFWVGMDMRVHEIVDGGSEGQKRD
jgi:ceramide glucosyltransferase